MSRQTTKIEDLENQKSFQIFVNAIKTEGTRKYYVRDLYAFLEFTKISDFDTLAGLSTDDIQDYLESYVFTPEKGGYYFYSLWINSLTLLKKFEIIFWEG